MDKVAFTFHMNECASKLLYIYALWGNSGGHIWIEDSPIPALQIYEWVHIRPVHYLYISLGSGHCFESMAPGILSRITCRSFCIQLGLWLPWCKSHTQRSLPFLSFLCLAGSYSLNQVYFHPQLSLCILPIDIPDHLGTSIWDHLFPLSWRFALTCPQLSSY